MSTWDILGVRLYDQETRAISIVWDKNCSVITVTGRGWGTSRKTMLSSRGNGGSWRGGRLIASAVWESLTTKLLLLALGVTNGRLGEPNNKIRAGLHTVSLTFLSSLYIELFWDIKTFFHHIFSNLNAVPQVWICLIMSQHYNQNTLSHDLYYDSKAILSS